MYQDVSRTCHRFLKKIQSNRISFNVIIPSKKYGHKVATYKNGTIFFQTDKAQDRFLPMCFWCAALRFFFWPSTHELVNIVLHFTNTGHYIQVCRLFASRKCWIFRFCPECRERQNLTKSEYGTCRKEYTQRVPMGLHSKSRILIWFSSSVKTLISAVQCIIS